MTSSSNKYSSEARESARQLRDKLRARGEQRELDAGVVDEVLADHVSQYAAVIAAEAIREAGNHD